MTDISKFDYRLLKKDIIYTFESMAQYVHLRFNQYIKDVLPAEILAQMESDQKNNLFKISTRPLNADLEEKLYAFIDGEVASSFAATGCRCRWGWSPRW